MRIILNCTVAIAACVASAAGAQSHTYPNKPIRLIIPFSAGGPSDVLGRALARQLSESFGQPVTVENRTGAGGNIGIDAVAQIRARRLHHRYGPYRIVLHQSPYLRKDAV